jgi:hypothetical protein
MFSLLTSYCNCALSSTFGPDLILLVVGYLQFQVSAYSSFARTVGLGYEQHKRRMDSSTNEPLFTNVTRDFIGSLDYIFYTGVLSCNAISFY